MIMIMIYNIDNQQKGSEFFCVFFRSKAFLTSHEQLIPMTIRPSLLK